MNAAKFMIAAYVATWVIHGGYLVTLLSVNCMLRRYIKDLVMVKKAPSCGETKPPRLKAALPQPDMARLKSCPSRSTIHIDP